jgi:hypothetical protein
VVSYSRLNFKLLYYPLGSDGRASQKRSENLKRRQKNSLFLSLIETASEAPYDDIVISALSTASASSGVMLAAR